MRAPAAAARGRRGPGLPGGEGALESDASGSASAASAAVAPAARVPGTAGWRSTVGCRVAIEPPPSASAVAEGVLRQKQVPQQEWPPCLGHPRPHAGPSDAPLFRSMAVPPGTNELPSSTEALQRLRACAAASTGCCTAGSAVVLASACGVQSATAFMLLPIAAEGALTVTCGRPAPND